MTEEGALQNFRTVKTATGGYQDKEFSVFRVSDKTNGGNSQGRKGGKDCNRKGTLICFKCAREGHYAKECPCAELLDKSEKEEKPATDTSPATSSGNVKKQGARHPVAINHESSKCYALKKVNAKLPKQTGC